MPFCALCTANALLTQRILSILWITFSKNYNSLAAAFANDYVTPSQKIRKISDGVFTKHAQRSAAISNIRVRVRSKMTDCATARHDLLPSRRNKSTEQFARRRNATPQNGNISHCRACSVSAVNANAWHDRVQTIGTEYPPVPRDHRKHHINATLRRGNRDRQAGSKMPQSTGSLPLYTACTQPATIQIGANRNRYSARTLRIPQLPMIAPAPSPFLLRKPRTSLLPASPLLPQR